MAYLAVLGASRGRLAGFFAVLGVALGLALLGIAVGLGGGSLVLNNRAVYESLRWAGALIFAGSPLTVGGKPATARDCTGRPISFVHFRRGLVTNLLNPKAALFFIAVVPEFIQGPEPSHELTILISIYVGVATLVHGLIVVLAAGYNVLRRTTTAQDGGQCLRRPAARNRGLAFRERSPLNAPALSPFRVTPSLSGLCVYSKMESRLRAIFKNSVYSVSPPVSARPAHRRMS